MHVVGWYRNRRVIQNILTYSAHSAPSAASSSNSDEERLKCRRQITWAGVLKYRLKNHELEKISYEDSLEAISSFVSASGPSRISTTLPTSACEAVLSVFHPTKEDVSTHSTLKIEQCACVKGKHPCLACAWRPINQYQRVGNPAIFVLELMRKHDISWGILR